MRLAPVAAILILFPALAAAEPPGGALAVRNRLPLPAGFVFDESPAEGTAETMTAVVDWYPGLGGLRLSGGLRVNGASFDLAAISASPLAAGGGVHPPGPGGRAAGTIEFNRFAPYLGIGWQGSMADGRVLIGLDFGALYQGRPDVRLTGGAPLNASALEREAAAIADELAGLRFSPVVSLTFTYRF